MKKLFVILVIIFSILSFSDGENSPQGLSFFSKIMKEFCIENPYDCNSMGVVVGVKADSFYKKLYKEVEKTIQALGFTKVQIEFCKKNLAYCYVDNIEDYERSNAVKDSEFTITNIFPSEKAWFEAFNPSRLENGITLIKELQQSEFSSYCSLEFIAGKKFKKATLEAINKKGGITLEELASLQKIKDINAEYRIYINFLHKFDPFGFDKLASECILFNGKRKKEINLIKQSGYSVLLDKGFMTSLSGKIPDSLLKNERKYN